MQKAPLIVNEAERLKELESLHLLDTADDEALNNIVKMAASISGCPVSLISLIDSDRQWFKARVGTAVTETPRDISFCAHTIVHGEMLEVENTLLDERFHDNPLVAEDPSIRFYAGQPLITKNGFKIGTLCALDVVPRKLNPEQKNLMSLLAKQAMYLIENRLNDLKLQLLQNNIERVFEKSDTIFSIMKGPEHRFEYVNSAHVKLLNGINATGKKVLEVQPEAKAGGILAILDEVYQQAKTVSLKDTPFLVGKSMKYFDFVFTPSFDVKEKVDGVIALVNDITAKRVLELELKKLNRENTVSLESLKEERDLRERFVAALSHDLRTPLTAAKMSAQILDRKADESSKKLTHRIINSMDRADEMIRDLLDASKIKAGEKFSLDLKRCSLDELAHETVEDLATVYGDRFRLQVTKPIQGFWDCELVRRILENLATNAVKYGSKEKPITIQVDEVGDRVSLAIHNEGNPIAEHEQADLFQAYRRSASAGTEKGWGIGLTLVKGFAEAMGGSI
jgi:signal transduction histidine kinase